MLWSLCRDASRLRHLTASFDSFAGPPIDTDLRSGKFGTYADRPIAAGASRLATETALDGFLGPDIRAPDLAIDTRHRLGRVNLKFGVLESRIKQRLSIVVNRNRARDAARP
jgi:hypothetical protein